MTALHGATVRINNGDPLPCTLTAETDRIDVSTFTPPRLPNPDWTFIDAAGHFHAFDADGKLPTLRERKLEHSRRRYRRVRNPRSWVRIEWTHRRWNETVLVCEVCGEQIKPTWRLGSCYQTMPGRTEYRLRVLSMVPCSEDRARVSVVVDSGSAQFFGFAQASGSRMESFGGNLADSWTEFTCYPFARRRPAVTALPPDGTSALALTPVG